MTVKWIILLVFIALWLGLSVGVQLGRRVQIAAGVTAAKKLLAARKERELHGVAQSEYSLQQPRELADLGRQLIERRKQHGQADLKR